MKFVNFKKEAGQTLIEVVAAATVLTIIIIAIVSVITASISKSTFARNKSLANKYVNEGIEVVRSIRDRKWTNLTAGTYGLRYSANRWEFYGSSDTPATGFTRVVRIVSSGTDSYQVTVEVSWTQGGRTYKSYSTINFTKWRP